MKNSISIKEYIWPRSHIVIDNFFSEDELLLIIKDIQSLENDFKIGLIGSKVNRYLSLKMNQNAIVGEKSNLVKNSFRLFKEKLTSSVLVDSLESAIAPIYNPTSHFNFSQLHFSRYENGQFYGEHKDFNPGTNLTIVFFWAQRPQKFSGGSFILFDNDQKKTIQFVPNRLIIFPSNTLHKVTPVKMKSKKFIEARFSIQIWPNLEKKTANKIDSSDQNKVSAQNYLVPFFGFDAVVWNEFVIGLQKFFSAKTIKNLPVLLNTITSGLEGQIAYLVRDLLKWEKVELSNWTCKKSGQDLIEIEICCQNKKPNSGLSAGYRIKVSQTNSSLELFFRKKSNKKYAIVKPSHGLQISKRILLKLVD